MNIVLLSLTILTSFFAPITAGLARQPARQVDRVREIIEEVELASIQAGNKLDSVRIRARAASLLWKIDPEIGRRRFEQLWAWVEANISQPIDVERARSDVLRSLIPLDRQLVERWMKQGRETSTQSSPDSLMDKLNGRKSQSSLGLNLANQLINDDPVLAAQLLGDVFDEGYSYQSHAVLRSLAEKDQQLADRVADRLLAVLSSQNDDRALIGIQQLFEYFYPRSLNTLQPPALALGESEAPMKLRDVKIRQRFFLVASSLLGRSVERSIRSSHTPGERRLIETNQALLAIGLSSVASAQPGIEMELVTRLNDLARRLRPAIPKELSGAIEAIEGSGRPDQSAKSSVAAENTEKGGNINQPNLDSLRTQLDRARHLSTIRAMIARRNLAEALGAILSIDDGLPRLILLGEIGRVVREENEPHFLRYLSTVTLKAADELPHSERKVEILLSLLQSDPSWRLVDSLIESLNGLSNNSERLLTSNALRQAFMNTIQLDKDGAFDKIKEIKSVSFELMARLALCEALLNQHIRN